MYSFSYHLLLAGSLSSFVITVGNTTIILRETRMSQVLLFIVHKVVTCRTDRLTRCVTNHSHGGYLDVKSPLQLDVKSPDPFQAAT